MAISDGYISVPEYKAWKDIESSDDDIILGWCIQAMSRVMDRKLGFEGTGFNLDAADAETSRVYIPQYTGYGSSPSVIDIDAVVSVSSVKVDTDTDGAFDESAVTVSHYRLLPLNATKGPEPKPYTQLEVTPWGSQGSWAATVQIQVTGRHGWPAVPLGIKWGCAELVSMVGGTSIYSTGRIQQLDQVVDQSPQARAKLNDLSQVYNRYPVMVA